MSAERRDKPAPAGHFDTLETQEHAAHFAMWVFIASETLLFAALFGLYTGYRMMYPDAFAEASHHNSAGLATAMTVVLLVSSFFVAWAVDAVRDGARRLAVMSLWIAVGLGAAFLAMKLYEYSSHISEGILPGAHYRFEELPGSGANLYFTLYYFLTALHALHVTAGMVILGVVAILIQRGHYGRYRHAAVDNGGIYWHLVDAIWIFLWPLLYLMG